MYESINGDVSFGSLMFLLNGILQDLSIGGGRLKVFLSFQSVGKCKGKTMQKVMVFSVRKQ